MFLRIFFSYKISEPKRNDIVICEYNDGIEKENFNKKSNRCPGDEINIVYDEETECYKTEVNGEVISEEYINEPMMTGGDRSYPVVLDEDEYFVMGDNRNNSLDARFWDNKFVAKIRIVAKCCSVIIHLTG